MKKATEFFNFSYTLPQPSPLSLGRPTAIKTLMDQASRHEVQGDYGAAAECYEQVLCLDSEHVRALSCLASLKWESLEYGRCLELQRRLILLDPSDWTPHFGSGLLYWRTKRWEEARVCFKNALERLPAEVAASSAWTAARQYSLAARLVLKCLGEPFTDDLWQEALTLLRDPDIGIDSKLSFLGMAGLTIESPESWKHACTANMALPAIEEALDRHDYLLADKISHFFWVATALQPHTREQWARCMAKLNPLFVAAGERERAALPPLLPPGGEGERLVVALIVDTSIVGSGLIAMETIVTEFAMAQGREFAPVVYCLSATAPSLREICLRHAIPLVGMDEQRSRPFAEDDLRGRLLDLRVKARQDGVAVAFYFSSFEWLVSLMSSIGLAPVQLFDAPTFHTLDVPRIDAYFMHAALVRGWKMVDGRAWRTVPPSLINNFPKGAADQEGQFNQMVAAARAAILDGKFRIILGSISRPVKIDGALLDAVARILKKHPQAVFLWFGKGDVPPVAVSILIEARGIAAQCKYMGWVNTLVFAKVIDIHLDPFNQPAGTTMFETFFAGRAYVLKRSPESDNIGMAPHLRQVRDSSETDIELAAAREIFRHPATGESLIMLADTADEYVEMVDRLIRDDSFRVLVGNAASRFMEQYWSVNGRVGRAYREHIAEIVNATGGR